MILSFNSFSIFILFVLIYTKFHTNSSLNLTLINMELAKRPPTSFFPVTSIDVEVSTQSFLTFSFNLFVRLVLNFKAIPSTSPKLLNLNQDHS